MKLLRYALPLMLAPVACGDSAAPDPLRFQTAPALPSGVRAQPYDQTVRAAGGVTPYRFELDSGALPAGLGLEAASGRLHGTPEASGTFAFALRVRDSAESQAVQDFSLVVAPPPLVLTSTALPSGKVGVAYAFELEASGGEPPVGFRVSDGALPEGLALSADGALAGTPSAPGVFELELSAFDATQEARKTFLLTIARNDPMLAPDPPPRARAGEPYTHELQVSSGVPPYTFELIAGALPAGLSLSAGGRLFGSPTQVGAFEFGVRVRDVGGRQDEKSYTLVVIEALTVVTSSPPQLIVGRPISFQFEATGGEPPYTWQFASGGLPLGLSLDASGLLTGTPVQTQEVVGGLRVSDAEGFQKLALFTFRVSDRYVYELQPELPIPAVCTGTTVSYNTVELEVPDSVQIAELDVTVNLTYLDAAEPLQNELESLKLVLYAPDGRRSVLCGNGAGIRGSTGCDETFRTGFVQATFDEQRAPNVPMSVFEGMNAQGTWRLVAVVVRPTQAAGACRIEGTIHAFALSIRPDFSPEPYVIIDGFTYNNLLIEPWLRIRGGGLAENSLDLVATIYDVGPNGLREGGRGDDVPRPAPLSWSAPNGCPLADLTADGHVEASSSQQAGSCDLVASGGGFVVDTRLHVLPPDWNPLVRQF